MERKYSLLKRGGKRRRGELVLGLALAIVRFGISTEAFCRQTPCLRKAVSFPSLCITVC